ncbi:hypothetical protein [Methylovulum miyakonense]|uniref:hypothetical protein n=1 Tax=Methylovulum miyakonense TaxID=645578 RepID=UPI00036155E2|nr:hypothetical protein [Methylovulum miyakonense]
MAKIIPLFPNRPPDDKTQPSGNPRTYTLEQLSKGIGIALLVTKDTLAARFLLGKFNHAVNSSHYDIEFTYQEVIQYADYLDPDKSRRYNELAIQLLHAYYSTP